MGAETPITAALDLLERAARTGDRAHLPADLARALIAHPAYARYAETRTKELIDSWAPPEKPAAPRKPATTTPPESSSGRSGSGIAANETSGASAGTMTAANEESVGRAASRRALEAVIQIRRQQRRKTR
jgi:hypothetical protein